MDLPELVREEIDIESRDFLGLSVIENRKIVLLQIGDGLAFAVNHHIHFHQPGVDAENVGVSWATTAVAAAARQSRPVHLIDPTIRITTW